MKKIVKLLFSLSLILSLGLNFLPVAFADEKDVAGKTWDEIVEGLLAEHNTTEGQVTLGYYNTVTGEEQFYDGDRYMVSGSMFKVPLSMVFAEKEAAGEIAWDDLSRSGYRYNVLVEGAIVNSNNDYAAKLWGQLGSYHDYRRIIAPYMGVDPDNVDDKYYENNFFTARQVISCLKYLYENRETFSYIIDLMKQAQQSEYFCRREDRYEVAHKYGYLADDAKGVLYLNDCGIVYTDDPYVLVCFTAGVETPYGVLADYCTLMSDYTQYQRKERIRAEAAAAEAERLAALEQEAGENGEESGPSEADEAGNTESKAGREKRSFPGWLMIPAAFAVFAAIAVADAWKSGEVDPKRLALIFAAMLMGLAFWFVSASPAG